MVVSEGRTRLDSDGDDCVIPEPISLEDFQTKVLYESSYNHEITGNEPSSKYFSVVMGQKRKREKVPLKKSKSFQAWKNAVAKIRSLGDPWEQFHFEEFLTEKAVRHRYNGLKKDWFKDEVTVRLESTPFGHGAMRECFRMKKLSNFSHSRDWRLNANNAVAKRYMSPVDRQMYFEEVKLQMDAKLWGEEFNRHNPPKKVDFCQMAVLEFPDRKGKPLYHVENFIEGNYIKYNSNSGFVADDVMRQTPQAFSHFTFERSGHELIVVDIQGVGDLYTDPQIHTAAGTEYGDGNLGTKGMALFFHSHQCNQICESLGLSKFDLATSEVEIIRSQASVPKESNTVLRGKEELCMIPSEYERTHLSEFLRMRSSSSIGSCSNLSESDMVILEDPEEDENGEPSGIHFRSGYDSGIGDSEKREAHAHYDLQHLHPGGRARRQRFISESSTTSTAEEERLMFAELLRRKSRPSRVVDEVDFRKSAVKDGQKGQSVLGKVHMDLARYHELSRFTSPGDDFYDKNAALFHLRRAADCGLLEAVIAAARIYLNLPSNILADLEVPQNADNESIGLDYMTVAAESGDRAAMIFLAKAFDTGLNLGGRERSWVEAVRLYSSAVTALTETDDDGHFDGAMDDPKYLLIARQAEMYKDGGYGLEVNYEKSAELFNEAAEEATAAMKGRLASKYYTLAEEVYGYVE